ncbi:MAG: hypothetical protein LR015_13495, partial [Verrucomicrobia bacterium]|nr:hypothetical protein [Verrucomicrobiota bacterium]
WKTLIRDGCMALVALYMVLCLYQPAAAFILLPVLFNWLINGRTVPDRLGLWWVATLYLLALGSYYIGLKILVDIVLQLNTQAERSALVSDLFGKIVFLVNEPLKTADAFLGFFCR